MLTRSDYLNKIASHEQYYREINAAGAVKFNGDIGRVREALDNEDYHLNTIPLAHWDGLAALLIPVRVNLDKAFRDRGDFPTQAGLVCCVKQAARDAA